MLTSSHGPLSDIIQKLLFVMSLRNELQLFTMGGIGLANSAESTFIRVFLALTYMCLSRIIV